MKNQKRITSAGLSINDPVDINAVGEQAIISPAIKK